MHSAKLYIDGAFCESEGGARFQQFNPATGEVAGDCPDASLADLQRAVAAARRAFDEGPWPRTSAKERADLLRKFNAGINKRKDAFRKVLIEVFGGAQSTHVVQIDTPLLQMGYLADALESFPFEDEVPNLPFPTSRGLEQIQTRVVRQPVGVCGLIPTWNFPLYVTLNKIVPALAMGCTAVVKPSPYGSQVEHLLCEILHELELPAGVINLVSGASPELGQALVQSPLVDKISFTGSVPVGKAIAAAAAPTLKRVHLELGGKSAMIILDDMEPKRAASAAATPCFLHAGQGCALATRVLVPRKMQDALVDAMCSFLQRKIKVGDPADPTTMCGPLISEERRAAVEAYIQAGKDEGARLVYGGGRPEGLERGFYVQPTVFADVSNDMKIAREEIFGPVVALIPYDDVDEAVRIANDSSMGLGGAVAAQDTDKARALARRMRTGQVSINRGANLIHAPFGGFKESGIGREGGTYGFHEFTEIQTISWV